VVEAEEVSVFKGRVLELRNDRVRLADGTRATCEIVVHPGGALTIPVLPPSNWNFVAVPALEPAPLAPRPEVLPRAPYLPRPTRLRFLDAPARAVMSWIIMGPDSCERRTIKRTSQQTGNRGTNNGRTRLSERACDQVGEGPPAGAGPPGPP
jgi:hypothetical protein